MLAAEQWLREVLRQRQRLLHSVRVGQAENGLEQGGVGDGRLHAGVHMSEQWLRLREEVRGREQRRRLLLLLRGGGCERLLKGELGDRLLLLLQLLLLLLLLGRAVGLEPARIDMCRSRVVIEIVDVYNLCASSMV